MIYTCKHHDHAHPYTVCPECQHQFCPHYWAACPMCATLAREPLRPLIRETIPAEVTP